MPKPIRRFYQMWSLAHLVQYQQLLFIKLIMKASHSVQSDPIPTLRSSISSTYLKLKHNTAFITTQKPIVQTPEALISEHYQQLNNYINLLQPKIQRIVEYNEAEVLLAYRNHFGKIKQQIEHFKQQTLDQVKNEANVLAKMADMERQLIVFREQALRLFSIVGEKDKIIQQLNLRIGQMTAQKKFMDNKLKQLIRNTKQMKTEQQIRQPERKESLSKNQVMGDFYSVGIHTFKKSTNRYRKIKDRILTLSNCERAKGLEETESYIYSKSNLFNEAKIIGKQNEEIQKTFKLKFGHLESNLLEEIIKTAEQVCNSIDKSHHWGFTKTPDTTEIKRTKCSTSTGVKLNTHKILSYQKKRSHTKSTFQYDTTISSSLKNTELSQYFQRCIQTVKKQIGRRKNNASLNFFSKVSPISLAQFRKIDFYRLVELVFANDRVIRLLYEALVTNRQ